MHEQPFLPKQVILEEGKESVLTILLHGMVEVEVRLLTPIRYTP